MPSTPHEHIADFTPHAWCNALLSDPTITHISARSIPDPRKTISNTYFTRTLFTPTAIRALLSLYRPGKGHTRVVDPSVVLVDALPLLDIPQPHRYARELQRQQAKEDVVYDPADPDASVCILLVSVGSDIDGGINRLHGGVTATLLDQAMGMLLSFYYENTSATTELSIRFKKAITTPCVLKVSAKLTRERGRWVEMRATVEDGLGTVFADGVGSFVLGKLDAAKI